MAIITLTTDFGTSDGYVGAMKGVILDIASDVTLMDISHAVPPQDVRHGARVLATATPFFSPGAIHVAVIDPGVGSGRRGIALQTPAATFVGPDNGLFTPFLEQRVACVALTNPVAHRRSVSATFHGRDIFAPVAGHLARGFPLAELGPSVQDPVVLPKPRPQLLSGERVRAQVVHVDRFGNLVTNLRLPQRVGNDVRVGVGERELSLRRTYADVASGALLALVGSSGYLEIAVREGSAAERLGLGVGAVIDIWDLGDALEDLALGAIVADDR